MPRITNTLNYLSRFDNSSISVVEINHLRNFLSDGLSQDESCMEIINH